MPPELSFLLFLLLRMAIAAAFVVTASVITERSGPVIGALVATLPISAGPSYVFLALDHDAAFIAEGALPSLLIAVTVWFSLATMIRAVEWSLAGGVIVNAIAYGICVPLLARYRHAK